VTVITVNSRGGAIQPHWEDPMLEHRAYFINGLEEFLETKSMQLP
jgi:hypothetical protein